MRIIIKLISCISICFPYSTFAIDFALFGDVVYYSASREQDNSSFNLGALDLIADQEIGESTWVTAEIVFEDPGHGFEVDIERFLISRSIKPLLSVGLGRNHTQLGFWNQYFHHGSLLQDTISRPFFLEFEDVHGGIFPNHVVGLHVNGESTNWGYQFSYANNSGINTTGAVSHPGDTSLEVINLNDQGNDKALVLRLFYKPLAFVEEFGVFYMANNVLELGKTEPGSIENPWLNFGDTLFEQHVTGIDIRMQKGKFYSLIEFFHMTNKDNPDMDINQVTPNPKSYDATAYYIQAGYQFSNKLTGVARFESLSYDPNATYFTLLDVDEEDRWVLAFNYRIQESNAIRLEYSKSTPKNSESFDVIGLQWFFVLFWATNYLNFTELT